MQTKKSTWYSKINAKETPPSFLNIIIKYRVVLYMYIYKHGLFTYGV